MRQSTNLENFKLMNTPDLALHSKFRLHTGQSLSDNHYGHLQMDVVALFLIALVEITAGGAQVIYTHHEVDFVQNLVFYIERTYRTPDFGIWEMGTRYNDGSPELHASSLGMVRVALEAINGFNLYGSKGTSASVIYVDIDGHDRNRTIFSSILPRESESKNTDSALLITIGWPFFATHDKEIFDKTIKKCSNRLEGKFGFKRYINGYQTELENKDIRFYGPHETFNFDKIECQWPIFFCYVSITAYMKGDTGKADEYWDKLRDTMTTTLDGLSIVPECYYLPEQSISREKAEPGSQLLYPTDMQHQGHFLWAQAVYIIASLLRLKLIHASELDPISRHLPANQRPKNYNRYSAFQDTLSGEPVVQIALISESIRLQMMLATFGITTQTPHEVEPVQIWPSSRMVKVFQRLGRNDQLQLSGRPPRPFGILNTSKIFRISGDTVLCFPLLFEVGDFYVNADPAVLIEDIKRTLQFVSRRWKMTGRPTFCTLLREANVMGEHFDQMLELLVDFKNGFVQGIRVRIGRVHQLLNSGCVEHVDFASCQDIQFDTNPLEELQGNTALMSDLKLAECYVETDAHVTEKDMMYKSDWDLGKIVNSSELKLRSQAFSVLELWKRHGENHALNNVNLKDHLDKVYRRAEVWKFWWLVRFCAVKLRKNIDSLAPAITTILVRGKQVTFGINGHKKAIITKPLTPNEIISLIFDNCAHAAVLQQELVIACADIISQNPESFAGILTIEIGSIADALDLMVEYDIVDWPKKTIRGPSTKTTVYDLAPTVIKKMVAALLKKSNWKRLSVRQKRHLDGYLNRVPINFYDKVWKILEKCEYGISISGNLLPQQPTLSDMTQSEMTFSVKVESMMSEIGDPEYRQIIVELLCVLSAILDRNPEFNFFEKLDLDSLINIAFNLFVTEHNLTNNRDMTSFYQLDDTDCDEGTTTTYLAKAVMSKMLKGSKIRVLYDDDSKEQCVLS